MEEDKFYHIFNRGNNREDIFKEKVTISGKCCESGDILLSDVQIPIAQSGDILATEKFAVFS